MSILEGDVEEYHPEWQFGGVKSSPGVRSKGMAVRDAGNFGWNLSFEDAVKKAREEKWEDVNIVALLSWRTPPPSLEDVKRVPKEVEKISLEDLMFRVDDTGGGGMIIEYKVDGRPRTQAVPKMVGQVLEALTSSHLEWVKDHLAIVKQYGDFIVDLRSRVKELENERHTGSSGRLGDSGVGDGSARRSGSGKRGPARKAKEKADT